MKRITTTLVAGLLIAGLIAPPSSWAQFSEPQLSEAAKAPKLTLQSVEAQVTTLQNQVSSLQSSVNSLQSAVTSLQPNFAVVNKDGTLARGSKSAVSSQHYQNRTGVYQVIFNRDVTGCGINATLGAPDADGFTPGLIGVSSLFNNPGGVAVFIFDPLVHFIDTSFHVSVICQ
jgi:hypothetical protein